MLAHRRCRRSSRMFGVLWVHLLQLNPAMLFAL
jgi:hypothetical protein